MKSSWIKPPLKRKLHQQCICVVIRMCCLHRSKNDQKTGEVENNSFEFDSQSLEGHWNCVFVKYLVEPRIRKFRSSRSPEARSVKGRNPVWEFYCQNFSFHKRNPTVKAFSCVIFGTNYLFCSSIFFEAKHRTASYHQLIFTLKFCSRCLLNGWNCFFTKVVFLQFFFLILPNLKMFRFFFKKFSQLRKERLF